jgi:hypothetical protein
LNELGQGLTLSGIGILITFFALGVLIGLILLLKALFPVKTGNSEVKDALRESSPPLSREREDLLRQAAAAGVSVLIKRRGLSGRGSLGKLLEDPVGDWWRKGVDRVHGEE